MRHKLFPLLAILLFSLLAVGGTVGAMVLTHSGFMGSGFGSGMMWNQQGYSSMMQNQQSNGTMMGRYRSTSTQQEAPVTDITHMTMHNVMYQFATIQVPVGTTVTWTNQDPMPHSITFQNGMMDSGLISEGQSFRYTFTTSGTYQYSCSVHPSLVATVTVVP